MFEGFILIIFVVNGTGHNSIRFNIQVQHCQSLPATMGLGRCDTNLLGKTKTACRLTCKAIALGHIWMTRSSLDEF